MQNLPGDVLARIMELCDVDTLKTLVQISVNITPIAPLSPGAVFTDFTRMQLFSKLWEAYKYSLFKCRHTEGQRLVGPCKYPTLASTHILSSVRNFPEPQCDAEDYLQHHVPTLSIDGLRTMHVRKREIEALLRYPRTPFPPAFSHSAGQSQAISDRSIMERALYICDAIADLEVVAVERMIQDGYYDKRFSPDNMLAHMQRLTEHDGRCILGVDMYEKALDCQDYTRSLQEDYIFSLSREDLHCLLHGYMVICQL
jgi:hypothetical protein